MTIVKLFKYRFNIRLLVFCYLTFLFSCCQVYGLQKTEGQLTNLTISNWGDKYEHIYYLNDEPLSASKGLSVVRCDGYPLKVGKNELKIVINPINTENEKESYNAQISIKIDSAEKEILYKELTLPAYNDRQMVEKFTFNIDEPVSRQPYFDDLTKLNQADFRKEIGSLSLELTKSFCSRNFDRLSKTVEITDKKLFKNFFPKWFFNTSIRSVKVISAQNYSDFDILIGKRFILVKPSKKLYQKLNIEGLVYTELIDNNSYFILSTYIFVKANDRWHLKLGDRIYNLHY